KGKLVYDASVGFLPFLSGVFNTHFFSGSLREDDVTKDVFFRKCDPTYSSDFNIDWGISVIMHRELRNKFLLQMGKFAWRNNADYFPKGFFLHFSWYRKGGASHDDCRSTFISVYYNDKF